MSGIGKECMCVLPPIEVYTWSEICKIIINDNLSDMNNFFLYFEYVY